MAALTDAEEWPDQYLHRPLAAVIVRLLLPTPVTPDQVTICSGVAGVLAASTLVAGIDRPVWRLGSAALLLCATVLDCVDGQLARARRTMSARGMALDAIADIVVVCAMVVAATWFVTRVHGAPRLWVLGAVVLASYALHCFFFDVIKERYLADHQIDYASSKAVHAAGAPGRRGARQTAFDLYWMAAGPAIRRSGKCAMTRGYVRTWTLLGPGTHMMCLYLATALAYRWPQSVAGCLLLFATAMNVLLLFLLAMNPRLPSS
jgi:phosphatidylglycerophosphate synthase